MRHVDCDTHQLCGEVLREAERKGFPACAADLEGQGSVMHWGPGISGWLDVLSRADFPDLVKVKDALLQLPRSPEVPGTSFMQAIVAAFVHSARLWARATVVEEELQQIEFTRVVKAGCPAVIDDILAQHHDALLTFWRDTYDDAVDTYR